MLEQFLLQLKATGANSYLRMFCIGHCLTQKCQQTLFHKFMDVKTIRQLVLEAFNVSSCHFMLHSLLKTKMYNLLALITGLQVCLNLLMKLCYRV